MNRRDRASEPPGAPVRCLWNAGWGGPYPTYLEPAAAEDRGSWREERLRALVRRYRRRAASAGLAGMFLGLAIGGGLAILGCLMGGAR